jgi:hypothetical protein
MEVSLVGRDWRRGASDLKKSAPRGMIKTLACETG